MTMRRKIGETASDFVETVALPTAEKVRHSADEIIERLGHDARHLGEKVGERVSAQVAEIPDAALQRFDLVRARTARRRTIFGVIVGIAIGALAAYFFNSEKGPERRRNLKSKIGVGSPQTAAATDGELPL